MGGGVDGGPGDGGGGESGGELGGDGDPGGVFTNCGCWGEVGDGGSCWTLGGVCIGGLAGSDGACAGGDSSPLLVGTSGVLSSTGPISLVGLVFSPVGAWY